MSSRGSTAPRRASTPDLDTLNRVVGSKWTKDLSTDVDFYRYTLTYDRNSNITKADQADDSNADSIADGHVGFDIAYTMDNLNRLTVADEGTFSGGSITSRTRKQEWTLTQTGNWSLDKLDLNGDADWSDPDEWQDSKTFNKVNEIGTRDLDATPGTTGDNYTLAYDAAGNMTNDGTDYKYEWDAFYRLRKVKTQGGVLVAEYRYNGLGYRTGVHEDTDTDSDVDGSDLWYYSAYDERWRMVATYRSSDTDPKERFVHQQAGDGGFGGNSYIDLVAFREKDTDAKWYERERWDATRSASTTARTEHARRGRAGHGGGRAAGDGPVLGVRRAVRPARRATQTRTALARRYGPNHHPRLDQYECAYDVRGDADLDGDVDSTDKSAVQALGAVTLGRGALSAITVGNRRGLAGCAVMQMAMPSISHFRARSLSNQLGAWDSRDPWEYGDSANLFLYVIANPVRFTDPFGLKKKSTGDGGSWFCPIECDSDKDCADCKICKSGYGTSTGGNPKAVKGLLDAAQLFDKMCGVGSGLGVGAAAGKLTAAAAGAVASSAMPSLAGAGIQGAKNLKTIADRVGLTTLWIKVCWENCETSRCFVFSTERKCEEQESGWVEVKPPNLSWALAEPRSKSYCKDLRDSYDRAKKTGCGKSKP
jgi:RHS repeat-associated protein